MMDVSTNDYYANHDEFCIAVDCIIFGFDGESVKLLIKKRAFEPSKGGWSLMGGFLHKNENLDEAAARVLFECTGLKQLYLKQLMTFSDIGRDLGGRVISTAYYALIDIRKYEQQSGDAQAIWVSLNELPTLIFDHNEMVEVALNMLRNQTVNYPVGIDLLPREFSLPTLQRLYESIFGYTIDKRNFRKKILETALLVCTNKKDYSTSRKGAYLYRYNLEKCKEIIDKGYSTSGFPRDVSAV